MSQDQERVTSVRFGFNVESLLEKVNRSRHEADQSVARYVKLCEEALRRKYPNAVIEVAYANSEGVLPTSMETLVYSSHDSEEIEDSREIESVEALCDRIYNQFDWLVPRNSVPVLESLTYCHLLPAVVRHACVRKHIEGAEKHSGTWDVPLNRLRRVQDDTSQSGFGALDFAEKIEYLMWEDMTGTEVDYLTEGTEYLVVSRVGFGIKLFTSNASDFILIRQGSKIHIKAEHFVDVEAWSNSRWAYGAYADLLLRQAKRGNVVASPITTERNGSEVTDGVVFHFDETVSGKTPLQGLLKDTLRRLTELISAAEISLAGGPVWDVSYEKSGQEARFCAEILEPLLRRMGYTSVRNTHGIDEYGRDFIFSRTTEFCDVLYLALQAKAGDVSGGASATINTLLRQIELAFSMPYVGEPEKSKSEVYIGLMIIAISGKYKKQAVEQIRVNMPKHLVGSVFFWDKPEILSLISHYWGKE